MKDWNDGILWRSKGKNKLSIINVYRLCEDNNKTGVSKTIIQQWDGLEVRDTEEINIQKNDKQVIDID